MNTKLTYWFLLLFTALAFCFTSCGDDDDINDGGSNEQPNVPSTDEIIVVVRATGEKCSMYDVFSPEYKEIPTYTDGTLIYAVTDSVKGYADVTDIDDTGYGKNNPRILVNPQIPSIITINGQKIRVNSIGMTRKLDMHYEHGGFSEGREDDDDNPHNHTIIGTIIIPRSITNIGSGAFSNCSNLTSINIPNSVTKIGSEAFENCYNLQNISLPSSVTTIEEGAFENCTKLTNISLPKSLTTIGKWMFSNCKSLTSIYIPSSVTSIDDTAFGFCSDLNSIQVDAANSVFDSRDNCNAIIETASNTLIVGSNNTVIPSSVTCLGNRAFWGRTKLTSITIPNSISSIRHQVFGDCVGLMNIKALRTNPSKYNVIGTRIFGGHPAGVNMSTCILHVPKGCTNAYKNLEPWSEFANIVDDAL